MRHVVTGDREVTSVLTVHRDGKWELSKGKLYDVTHLPCRSALYTPATAGGACTPAQAKPSDFPVTPGAAMPAVQGCAKQDYAVLFVVGVERDQRELPTSSSHGTRVWVCQLCAESTRYSAACGRRGPRSVVALKASSGSVPQVEHAPDLGNCAALHRLNQDRAVAIDHARDRARAVRVGEGDARRIHRVPRRAAGKIVIDQVELLECRRGWPQPASVRWASVAAWRVEVPWTRGRRWRGRLPQRATAAPRMEQRRHGLAAEAWR